MKINRTELNNALSALGKVVSRTSPVAMYRNLRIQSADSMLRLSVLGTQDFLTVEVMAEEVPEGVDQIVNFTELRDAVRASGSTVMMQSDTDQLRVRTSSGDRVLANADKEWLEPQTIPVSAQTVLLPENFTDLLKTAAPVVNRNEYRKVLQGIHLSVEGITATNGKELLHIPCLLNLAMPLNLPFPLALLATHLHTEGELKVWGETDGTFFQIRIGGFTWQSKALEGTYPNWKQVIPKAETLPVRVQLTTEEAGSLTAFLKSVPDTPPNHPVKLYRNSNHLLVLETDNGMTAKVSGDFRGSWDDFQISLNRHLLLRLLNLGHTLLCFGETHAPLMASGGIGNYISMPLAYEMKSQEVPATESNTETNPVKEEKTMNETNVPKIVTMPLSKAPEIETAASVNPLEDLNLSVDAFKQKLKGMLDEAALLSRKVKEAALQQKQKERDFVLAKRAIERIRMAI